MAREGTVASSGGLNVAVKVMRVLMFGQHTSALLEEISACIEMIHPNINRTYGYFIDSTEIGICSQKQLTSLKHILSHLERNHRTLAPLQILSLSIHLCLGMTYLHACGIMHRNIHPANFLLSNEWQLKIADFGMPTYLASKAGMLSRGGAEGVYWAPEVAVTGDFYLPCSEVWSFGLLLAELCNGKLLSPVVPLPSSAEEKIQLYQQEMSLRSNEEREIGEELKEWSLASLLMCLVRATDSLQSLDGLEEGEAFKSVMQSCFLLETLRSKEPGKRGSSRRSTFGELVARLVTVRETLAKGQRGAVWPLPVIEWLNQSI